MSDLVATVIALAITLALLGILVVAVLLFRRIRARRRMITTLRMSLFLIQLPRYTGDEDENKTLQERIAVMEQLFASIAHVKKRSWWNRFMQGPERIVFEIASSAGEEDIGFYIGVPHELETQIERNVHAVYPNAEVTRVKEDYNIFRSGNRIEASYMTLGKANICHYRHMKR